MAKIKTVFQFRRATTAEWLAHKDAIPAPGEPCYDLELHTLRIGDGNLTYEKLPVIGGIDVKLEGDGKSVVLEDEVFKLAGFDAASVGAQPRKSAEGKLEWVVPSTKDVDDLKAAVKGLQSNVTSIQNNVTNIQNVVTNIQEIVTPSGDGAVSLLDRVDGLEHKMDGTGEGTVDAKIDAKINQFAADISDDGKVNTIKELVDYVAGHAPEVASFAADIKTLQDLVGGSSVTDQIIAADLVTRAEAENNLLSKVDASVIMKRVKYEVADVPAGTLVNYGEKEIRIMVPANAEYHKQAVGTGGDANTYYMTFKVYAPSDDAVGYIEHLGGQSDAEILTNFSVDKYGRRYQPTWLGLAKYDEATGEWNYYGKNSTANKYIGWDYRIDWYDKNGVKIGSDSIRINLSNEDCHDIIEPYYMANTITSAKLGDTLLEVVDRQLVIPVGAGLKSSDEITVNEDGSLSVVAVDVSKLIQTGDIVFDGGNAAEL